MNNQIKNDITEIILEIYQVPGQYTIGAMILLAVWNIMKDKTEFAIILPIVAIVCIILEIVSPIIAGKRLYDQAVKNIKKLLK